MSESSQAYGPADFRFRGATLNLDGWAGWSKQRVLIVGETATKYRIKAITITRLAGRQRSLDPGKTALVPKSAITEDLA